MRIQRLTRQLRKELKTPLGLLIPGSFDQTMLLLARLIEKEKPEKVISVGDVVSENIMNAGIHPQVLVVDNRVMRKPIEPIQVNVNQVLHVKNPSGGLTKEVWHVMAEALRSSGTTKVVVEGEEDLLTLVGVLCAPKGSLVVYGQPRKGVVIVRVTEKTIDRIRKIVDAMEICS